MLASYHDLMCQLNWVWKFWEFDYKVWTLQEVSSIPMLVRKCVRVTKWSVISILSSACRPPACLPTHTLSSCFISGKLSLAKQGRVNSHLVVSIYITYIHTQTFIAKADLVVEKLTPPLHLSWPVYFSFHFAWPSKIPPACLPIPHFSFKFHLNFSPSSV